MSTEQEFDTFESADAGASLTYPTQANGLKHNGHVLMKGRPCKIVQMTSSKPGKHGHAKVSFVGIDVFTEKKYEDQCPASHNMEVPIVRRQDYQLVDIDDGYLHMMTQDGQEKNDVKVPEGALGEHIESGFNKGSNIAVTLLCAMGEEKVCAMKESTD